MSVHDTQNPETREAALDAAVAAIRDAKLIVMPTDTVYGIAADAFDAAAVEALLEAKGRGRETPPPVLVADPAVLHALAVDAPDYVEDLVEAFWPGPLTLILTAQPSLTWDLGETHGTVALRMPDDDLALDLLRRTGPLAVSSANRHGKPAALQVLDAATQLGDAVEEYLDAGPARIGTSSTIIDTTVQPPEIVREGHLDKEQIIAAVGDIFAVPEPEPSPEDESTADPDADPAADSATEAGRTADDSDPASDDSSEDDAAADPTAAEAPAAPESALDLPSEPDFTAQPEPTGAPETPLQLDDQGPEQPGAAPDPKSTPG